MVIRVVDLHARRALHVGRGDGSAALATQVHGGRLVEVGAQHQALDVQDDVGDILLHARDGGELVQHAVNADARHRRARNGRQQGTAQRVAEGVAETGLQRLDDEPGTRGIDEILGERGTLGNEHDL